MDTHTHSHAMDIKNRWLEPSLFESLFLYWTNKAIFQSVLNYSLFYRGTTHPPHSPSRINLERRQWGWKPTRDSFICGFRDCLEPHLTVPFPANDTYFILNVYISCQRNFSDRKKKHRSQIRPFGSSTVGSVERGEMETVANSVWATDNIQLAGLQKRLLAKLPSSERFRKVLLPFSG